MTTLIMTDKPEPRTTKWVFIAFAVGLALRLLSVWIADIEMKPRSLEAGYLDAAASLASGKGLLMWTPDSTGYSAIETMQALEASGSRINANTPYPTNDKGWVPATVHPAGYSLVLWAFYAIGNVSGMLFLAKITPVVFDAAVCILLFVFARNIFNYRIGLYSAWIYALLPSAIVLNLQFLPDTYARFFAALALSLASYTRAGKTFAMPAAGLAAGVGFHFRAEFLIWPLVLWLCLIFDSRKILSSTALALFASISMLIAVLPWTIWTYHSTGQPLLSTSGAGGAMYESLGEIHSNPWGIVLNDDYLVKDARRHGFTTAWTPEADKYYKDLWIKHILNDPWFYAKTVVTQRLPLALIPPFGYRGGTPQEFNIAAIQRSEGLTKLGVVARYPLETLQSRAVEAVTTSISILLLCAMIGATWLERNNWRSMCWLIFPWLVSILSMSLIKQIEARNMSVILVVQVIALAIVLVAWMDRRHPKLREG